MVNLNKIRSEIRAMLEISNEFSIDPNGQFAGLQKADAIQNLQMLFEHLKERKVDEIFFNQTTSYFAKPDNIGASYRNKDAGISDIQIRKIILSEIERAVELIENRYVFMLSQDMPEFYNFLKTGVALQKQIETTNSTASNFQYNDNTNVNQPIKKATLIEYWNNDDQYNQDDDYYTLKIACSANEQSFLKTVFGEIEEENENFITIKISDKLRSYGENYAIYNKNHKTVDPCLKKLYTELKKSYPNYIDYVKTNIDVTDIVNEMYEKLNHTQQRNTWQYRN